MTNRVPITTLAHEYPAPRRRKPSLLCTICNGHADRMVIMPSRAAIAAQGSSTSMPFNDSIRFDKPPSIIELQAIAGFDPAGSQPDHFALEFRLQLPGLRARAELVCQRDALEVFARGLLAASRGQHRRVRLVNELPNQSMIDLEQRDRRALLSLQGHLQQAGALFQVDAIPLDCAELARWYSWCHALLATRPATSQAGHDARPGWSGNGGARPVAASARQPASEASPAAMNAPA